MSVDNIIETYETEEDEILTYFSGLKDDFKKNWIHEEYVLGKGGKEIKIYKIRTMEYVSSDDFELKLKNNEMNDEGKFHDDTRIIPSRKWMRKYFVDELPQFINVVKREMKLVGVRPKRKSLWVIYTTEQKRQSLNQLPGMGGVQYADDDHFMKAEQKYLDSYNMHPVLTDIGYICKIAYRILFKGVRSS